MPTLDIYAPEPYAWWVLWLGIVSVSVAIIWLGWILIRLRMRREPKGLLDEPTLADISTEMHQRYWQQIQEVAQGYRRGEIDLRDVHLSLSALMRALATERSGIDLEVATTGEIKTRFKQWPALGTFLERCEAPSFGPQSGKEFTEETLRQAEEVISQ